MKKVLKTLALIFCLSIMAGGAYFLSSSEIFNTQQKDEISEDVNGAIGCKWMSTLGTVSATYSSGGSATVATNPTLTRSDVCGGTHQQTIDGYLHRCTITVNLDGVAPEGYAINLNESYATYSIISLGSEGTVSSKRTLPSFSIGVIDSAISYMGNVKVNVYLVLDALTSDITVNPNGGRHYRNVLQGIDKDWVGDSGAGMTISYVASEGNMYVQADEGSFAPTQFSADLTAGEEYLLHAIGGAYNIGVLYSTDPDFGQADDEGSLEFEDYGEWLPFTAYATGTYYFGIYSLESVSGEFSSDFWVVPANSWTTSSITYTYSIGSSVPLLYPSKTGYNFSGYSVTSGSSTYNKTYNTVSVVNNSTLTANWTAKTTIVKLEQNGGSGGTTRIDATYDSEMPAITKPSRTGYTFQGYFDTSATSGGTQYYTSTGASARVWHKAIAGSNFTTLYARWTENKYTVTVNPNGGTYNGSTSSTSLGSKNYTTVISVSSPTRTGYNFTGWTVTEGLNPATALWGTTNAPTTSISSSTTKCVNGIGLVYFKSITPTNNDSVTLTANWQEKAWTDSEYVASSYASGTGTQQDPYIIKTAGQLGKLSLDSQTSAFEGVYFKLGANIDLNAHQWVPINILNIRSTFMGNFDGSYYKISNLRITEGNYNCAGLFGQALYVSNIILEHVTIDMYTNVGAIMGGTTTNSEIKNCIVSYANLNGRFVGGLVGRAAAPNVIISGCLVKNSALDGDYCGAFIGDTLTTGRLTACAAYGISGANCKSVNGSGGLVESMTGVYSETELEGKKMLGNAQSFGDFTYDQYLNDGMPMPSGLFAVGGQSGSENVYNYLVEMGFEGVS